jgi:DNA-binding MurR/RpiR family transcriptional regulator
MADIDTDFEADAAPREFAALRALIVARAQKLPRRLTQVASYALENPDEIAFGTAAGIAQRAGVQPSTLVRFAQSLGYQGFSDLQEVFRSRLRERVPSYDERLKQLQLHGHSASEVGVLLDGFSQAAARSIADFRHSLDPQVIDRAADLMAGAETIYLAGLRRSFPITSYMAYAMGKLGVRNILVDGVAGLGAEQISFISARDAMLAISFTPYASETVALAAAAKEKGATIVSVTDSIFSPIAPIADIWLEVVEANFEGFRSMAATMALAMTLSVAVAGKRREKPKPSSGPRSR